MKPFTSLYDPLKDRAAPEQQRRYEQQQISDLAASLTLKCSLCDSHHCTQHFYKRDEMNSFRDLRRYEIDQQANDPDAPPIERFPSLLSLCKESIARNMHRMSDAYLLKTALLPSELRWEVLMRNSRPQLLTIPGVVHSTREQLLFSQYARENALLQHFCRGALDKRFLKPPLYCPKTTLMLSAEEDYDKHGASVFEFPEHDSMCVLRVKKQGYVLQLLVYEDLSKSGTAPDQIILPKRFVFYTQPGTISIPFDRITGELEVDAYLADVCYTPDGKNILVSYWEYVWLVPSAYLSMCDPRHEGYTILMPVSYSHPIGDPELAEEMLLELPQELRTEDIREWARLSLDAPHCTATLFHPQDPRLVFQFIAGSSNPKNRHDRILNPHIAQQLVGVRLIWNNEDGTSGPFATMVEAYSKGIFLPTGRQVLRLMLRKWILYWCGLDQPLPKDSRETDQIIKACYDNTVGFLRRMSVEHWHCAQMTTFVDQIVAHNVVLHNVLERFELEHKTKQQSRPSNKRTHETFLRYGSPAEWFKGTLCNVIEIAPPILCSSKTAPPPVDLIEYLKTVEDADKSINGPHGRAVNFTPEQYERHIAYMQSLVSYKGLVITQPGGINRVMIVQDHTYTPSDKQPPGKHFRFSSRCSLYFCVAAPADTGFAVMFSF